MYVKTDYLGRSEIRDGKAPSPLPKPVLSSQELENLRLLGALAGHGGNPPHPQFKKYLSEKLPLIDKKAAAGDPQAVRTLYILVYYGILENSSARSLKVQIPSDLSSPDATDLELK